MGSTRILRCQESIGSGPRTCVDLIEVAICTFNYLGTNLNKSIGDNTYNKD
jgi:hypothetical protein